MESNYQKESMRNYLLFSVICTLFFMGRFCIATPSEWLKTYSSIQQALANDQWEKAKQLAEVGKLALKGAEESPEKKMLTGLEALGSSASDSEARKAFGHYSEGTTELIRANGDLKKKWQLFYCPMVPKDTFRFWVQSKGTDLRNPYYGSKMLTCGVKRPW
ncbi:DUF3347 domain-containing protein [bacterium]|nr:DUF3347 domain-containing protein [bacterium]NBX82823.1 DUF3347 domain-containing protein [bacterium]